MSSKGDPIQLALKYDTAKELYLRLRSQEGDLTRSLQGLMQFLEKKLQEHATIGEMEEWIEEK